MKSLVYIQEWNLLICDVFNDQQISHIFQIQIFFLTPSSWPKKIKFFENNFKFEYNVWKCKTKKDLHLHF